MLFANGLVPVACALTGVGIVDCDPKDIDDVPVGSMDSRKGFVEGTEDASVVPVWKGCCGCGANDATLDCGIEESVF